MATLISTTIDLGLHKKFKKYPRNIGTNKIKTPLTKHAQECK